MRLLVLWARIVCSAAFAALVALTFATDTHVEWLAWLLGLGTIVAFIAAGAAFAAPIRKGD